MTELADLKMEQTRFQVQFGELSGDVQ